MSDYSIVIPTRNRPGFLKRCLGYYSAQRLSAPIWIADGSEGDCATVVRACVDSFRTDLDVCLIHGGQDKDIFTRLKPVVEGLDTPFLVLVSDDDFAIPEALDHAAEYLSDNNDYAAVVGRSIGFSVEGDGIHGPIRDTFSIPQKNNGSSDPSVRIVRHLSHYSTTAYSMKRREHIDYAIDILSRCHFTSSKQQNYFELLESAITVAMGKVHVLDEMFYCRQVHRNMTSRTSQNGSSDASNIFDHAALDDFICFCDTLTEALVGCQQIDQATARDTVYVGGWSYIQRQLKKRLKQSLIHYEAMENVKAGLSGVEILTRLRKPTAVLKSRDWHLKYSNVKPGDRQTVRNVWRAVEVSQP